MLLQIPDITPALPDSVPDVDTEIGMLRSLPFDELMQRLVSSMVTFAINLAIAIFVFYIGRLVINKLYRFVSGLMIRRRVDRSLTTFVLSLVRMLLYFILIVTVIGILGIETSSFIAIFASAGVAIGMALSGTLQNFAGGVLILLLKPYKIGDYIEAQGYAGFVREIQIFHTIVCTSDNKSIIIPNGGLSTGSVNNWSREDYRRVDLTVGISYGDDIDTARRAILDIISSDPRIVSRYVSEHRKTRAESIQNKEIENNTEYSGEPEPAEDETIKKSWFGRMFGKKRSLPAVEPLPANAPSLTPEPERAPSVVVAALADSSVNLKVTVWVNTNDYWGVYYTLNERFYKELPAAGINFPFPQLDVHIASETACPAGNQQ